MLLRASFEKILLASRVIRERRVNSDVSTVGICLGFSNVLVWAFETKNMQPHHTQCAHTESKEKRLESDAEATFARSAKVSTGYTVNKLTL